MNEIFTNFKEIMTQKYATFSGRAGRKEYWLFQLFNFIVSFFISILAFSLGDSYGGPNMVFMIILWIYSLALLIPSIAVTVRRLHDLGKGGGWIFISAIPILGGIILLILMICKGEPQTNRFGEPIQ